MVNKKTRNVIKMAHINGYPVPFISFLAKVSEEVVIEVIHKGMKEKYLTTSKMPRMQKIQEEDITGRFLPRGVIE